MEDRRFIGDYLEHFQAIIAPENLAGALLEFKECLEGVKKNRRKVMLAGNGASASLASHYALDFTKQGGVRSMAFNDAPLVTAYGNDYGYENWVARAVEDHADPGDLVVLISSSGRSPNMISAAEIAPGCQCGLVTLTGFDSDNPLRAMGDVNLWVDSSAYNVVESVHALWLGLVCDLVVGKREYFVKA